MMFGTYPNAFCTPAVRTEEEKESETQRTVRNTFTDTMGYRNIQTKLHQADRGPSPVPSRSRSESECWCWNVCEGVAIVVGVVECSVVWFSVSVYVHMLHTVLAEGPRRLLTVLRSRIRPRKWNGQATHTDLVHASSQHPTGPHTGYRQPTRTHHGALACIPRGKRDRNQRNHFQNFPSPLHHIFDANSLITLSMPSEFQVMSPSQPPSPVSLDVEPVRLSTRFESGN